MTEEQRIRFEAEGFLTIRGALSPDETPTSDPSSPAQLAAAKPEPPPARATQDATPAKPSSATAPNADPVIAQVAGRPVYLSELLGQFPGMDHGAWYGVPATVGTPTLDCVPAVMGP